jgi:NADPH:quinone reductase-like Zn-dependent oxidoreductase
MRAILEVRPDGPEAVQLDDDVRPPPTGADLVSIDVHAAGVAFPDVLRTRGLYQDRPYLPFILGLEFAGTVRSAPADAPFARADRVAAYTTTGSRQRTDLMPQLMSGAIAPVISQALPLEQAAEALTLVDDRALLGKAVLTIRADGDRPRKQTDS